MLGRTSYRVHRVSPTAGTGTSTILLRCRCRTANGQHRHTRGEGGRASAVPGTQVQAVVVPGRLEALHTGGRESERTGEDGQEEGQEERLEEEWLIKVRTIEIRPEESL